jgi:hypothetical protein
VEFCSPRRPTRYPPISGGVRLEGFLPESLSKEDVEDLVARLIDLARAYKQLGRSTDHAQFAIFALQDLTGKWFFFVASALGFGSRNAVLGFNLSARALRFILTKGLRVAVTHFFDDFSHIEPRRFSAANADCVEWLFDLLGWDYKKSAEDLLPPASVFAPLGVLIDLSSPGLAVVSNTPKRRAKILEEIEFLISLESVPGAAVESLLGVCQFTKPRQAGVPAPSSFAG